MQSDVLKLTEERSEPAPSHARLGCLPYLNVKPLVYPFEHGELPRGWELVYATPSTLARMLGEASIDVAPVSSFAWFANPRLGIVPGICISSDGPVETVLMLSKVPVSEVRSVAADISSLSGRALLRIILSESFGVEPEFVDCEPKADKMLAEHDAALIIGNPAMLCDKAGLHVLDLGLAWKQLTGLPAVFAVWAGQKESRTPELITELTIAKEKGMRHVGQIAYEEANRLWLPFQDCKDYLTKIIKYDLGEREMESLERFRLKAIEHGLVGERTEGAE